MGRRLPVRLPQPGAPLSFSVTVDGDGLEVLLTGWDRLLNGRSAVRAPRASLRSVWVEERGSLEALVDSRVLGYGTHAGLRRPGRRRVGTMMGRGHVGRQFWAVAAGPDDQRLLVVDVTDGHFSQVIVQIADPDAAARLLAP